MAARLMIVSTLQRIVNLLANALVSKKLQEHLKNANRDAVVALVLVQRKQQLKRQLAEGVGLLQMKY